MTRLATGQKANVDKKQMRLLTVKNYEKLPEIIKKKQEEKRQEELKAAKEKAHQYQKELNNRLRSQIKRKKEREGSFKEANPRT